jgi:hypothetical protein
MIKLILQLILVLTVVSITIAQQKVRSENNNRYPHELPKFKMYKDAPWQKIRLFEDSGEDVRRILGSSYLDYTWKGTDWHVVVFYIGEKNSCNDKPWPASLKGKVFEITVFPKSRIDFSAITFPQTFKKSAVYASHASVGWDSYSDNYGLEYEVYSENSSDGKIHKGDLRAITYGLSKKMRKEKTGCE